MEWANEIKNKDLKKAYIICGEEEYIRQKAIGMMIKALSFVLPDINHIVFEGRAKAADIIRACETLPVMDEKRLVQVKNYEPLNGKGEDTKQIEDYLEKLPETTVLLFDTAGKADKRRKLYKIVEKIGNVQEFNKPPTQKIIQTIVEEAKTREIKITRDAVAALIQQSGDDLYTLMQELDKLAVLKDDGAVKKEDVIQVASKSLEYDVFSMHRLFIQGKAAQALALLNQVLEAEKSAFGVIGMIAAKFRLLLKARVMLDMKYAYQDILNNMGANPFAAKEAIQDSKYFNAEEIRAALKALADLDYKLKSGQGGSYLTENVLLILYKKIKKPSSAGKLDANNLC